MPTRKAPAKRPRETGARSKIRIAGLEAVVRKLAAEGMTFREIAQKLATEHNCPVSHVSVKRFIDEDTDERRTAARSVAAQDAKESVPLVTTALRQIVVMNLKAATIAFIGEAREGTKEEPKPDIPELAAASRAATSAARALHAVTMGETPSDAMSTLRAEATRIIQEKRQREREQAEQAHQHLLN